MSHRFLHQEHHAAMEDLIQGINTTTTKGTDHTPIMIPDITADHRPAPIHTATEATNLEGTPYAFPPATTAAQATLQLMDTPTMITTCIVTPHPIFTISPADTTPQTKAALAPAAPTMQHKILSPGR